MHTVCVIVSLVLMSKSMFCSLLLSTPQDGDILIDYSKNRINDEVFSLLVDLVSVSYSNFPKKISQMSVLRLPHKLKHKGVYILENIMQSDACKIKYSC